MNHESFFVIGATHHTAPIAVRERLSLSAETASVLNEQLKQVAGLREFTLLNTCNRIEFYGVAEEATTASRVQAVFCAQQQFDPGEFEQFRLRLNGLEAIRHLLDVAGGLDDDFVCLHVKPLSVRCVGRRHSADWRK